MKNELGKVGCVGAACAALVAGFLVGCGGDQVVVKSADEAQSPAAAIDADPVALLPGGAIGFMYVDAQRWFASKTGAELEAIVRDRMPIPKGADFVPRRDLKAIYLGSYAMQGTDIAAVAVGSFKPEAIEKAASSQDKTMGYTVVRSQYAGRTMYTAKRIGFAVLSERTAIFGNDTGIRRILDRLKRGKLKRQLPAGVLELLKRDDVPMVAGADLSKNPLPESVAARAPFVQGLTSVHTIGNFEQPGLNFAGTAVYKDATHAEQGATSLRAAPELLKPYGWLLSTFLGTGQPLKRIDARAKDNQLSFVIGVDGEALSSLAARGVEFLGIAMPAQKNVEATKSHAVEQESEKP